MDFFSEYGLFLAKTVTVLIAVLIVVGSIFASSSKSRPAGSGGIRTRHINKEFDDMESEIKKMTLSKDALKEEQKEKKKKEKEVKKSEKKSKGEGKNKKSTIYVLDFDGDKEGSEVEELRKEVTALLTVATPEDKVLLRVESPGGMVHTYGLAAAQLERIKKAGIDLTISVDKVAASGGYLMACIADKLLAAPFAIVGSVGVLVEVTNFNRLLKKNNVDVEVLTAGEHKHTISMLGEITPEAREKTLEDLAAVHVMFKDFVKKYRPQLDIDKIATGEYWHGTQAIELKMVDEILTSDEYLINAREDHDIFELSFKAKESFADKLGLSISTVLEKSASRLLKRLNNPPV